MLAQMVMLNATADPNAEVACASRSFCSSFHARFASSLSRLDLLLARSASSRFQTRVVSERARAGSDGRSSRSSTSCATSRCRPSATC
eukprot:558045-Rhodomonas_salina.1